MRRRLGAPDEHGERRPGGWLGIAAIRIHGLCREAVGVDGRLVRKVRRRRTAACGPSGDPDRAMAVLGLAGALLLTPLLAWISPVLVLLVTIVVGIGWLCFTGADPVHRGPIPVASPRDGAHVVGSGRRRALVTTAGLRITNEDLK